MVNDVKSQQGLLSRKFVYEGLQAGGVPCPDFTEINHLDKNLRVELGSQWVWKWPFRKACVICKIKRASVGYFLGGLFSATSC